MREPVSRHSWRSFPRYASAAPLAEWTAAAKSIGIDLKGRKAQFVDNTCNATTTAAEVKASRSAKTLKGRCGDGPLVP